jgi:PKD repeat protein
MGLWQAQEALIMKFILFIGILACIAVLSVSCLAADTNPVVNFAADQRMNNVTGNVTIGFTDLTLYALSPVLSNIAYNWSFGDGKFSNETNPYHIYNATGNYAVSLTVTGQDTLMTMYSGYNLKPDYISVNSTNVTSVPVIPEITIVPPVTYMPVINPSISQKTGFIGNFLDWLHEFLYHL